MSTEEALQPGVLPPQVVIFDFDGTVINSVRVVVECFGKALQEEAGLYVPPEELQRFIVGPPLQESFLHYIPDATPERVEEMVANYRAHYTDILDKTEVFPGVAELLRDLHARGVRLAVGTSRMESVTKRILKIVGLADVFEVVSGSDGTLEGAAKPLVIGSALERLGNPDKGHVVMVGDRHYDVIGAREVGIPAVLVTWADTAAPGEEAGAFAVANTPNEVLTALGF